MIRKNRVNTHNNETNNRSHTISLSEELNSLHISELVPAASKIPVSKLIKVFPYLKQKHQEYLIHSIPKNKASMILSKLKSDDISKLLSNAPPRTINYLLPLLSYNDREYAKSQLKYPSKSVGRIMTDEFITVHNSWTVGRAMQKIRKEGMDAETLHFIYVVDDTGRLLDDIRLRTLVIASANKKISSLMDRHYASLSPYDDQEKAVVLMRKYDHYCLPVVDKDYKIIGIVTADDILDVAEEEATEDIHKGASIMPLKESYTHTSIMHIYGRRIWWLALLVIINLVSSGVIAAYEETLAGAIALAFFIPLLIDSGGNTGSQSATLMIRAMATGDVAMRMWRKVFVREIIIGILLGVTLGFMAYWLGVFRANSMIGFVVGITMILIIIVSNILGAMLPFILSKLNVDPAMASAPLITSFADAIGLLIYLSVATMIL